MRLQNHHVAHQELIISRKQNVVQLRFRYDRLCVLRDQEQQERDKESQAGDKECRQQRGDDFRRSWMAVKNLLDMRKDGGQVRDGDQTDK